MHKVVHEAFEIQARQRGNAVALSLADKTLTYRELDARSNQLAARLRSLGVRPDVPVVLYLDRTLEMVVAILGVLKAGGCYVPIDLAYPKERVAFMLEDTAAPILLTQESLASSLPAHRAKVLRLDADWPSIASESDSSQPSEATGSNAAYIIYTSGSTGKPKGVVVTHHNVLRLVSQTDHWYGFNTNDVWPLFHSYAFDVSVWEIWGSLLHGGRLVVVPYLVSRSPADFYQLLAREKVTVLNQTPSAFRQLIWAEATAETKLDLNLRYVICAGEALELQSLKPWFERHGDKKPFVVNMYGITETTVHSTYRVITQEDLTSGVGSVIGVPIPDLQIYLVDDQLKPVPTGTVGEICVGGDGVARGYLNRNDLTAQRFLADPFSKQPGARMYRSGDLARYSEQGELEYLGRMDHQVKIRGFRVELGEIESALNSHPAIRESVVLARDEGVGDKRLAAYIVPRGGTAPTVTELRAYLKQRIPEYMIPARFIVLTALPLTTNGKVDRRALPAPDDARPELDRNFTPPRNDAERTLAAIWSDVLGVAQVGVLDNFFELGGDSIRSIAILSRAQEQGLKLSLQQMFEHPTVAGMAACATSSEQPTALRPIAPFEMVSAADREHMPEDVEDAYPMTRLQLGMFFHNEFDAVSAIYHDVFSFRIEAAFDREKLADSLSRLVQRHPILRTSFHIAGYSEPLQLVHRQARFRLTVDDLRETDPEEQAKAVVGWIEREKRMPFDRTTAPLVRFHAQWQSEKAFQFIVSFHHSCLDGWSLAAVLTEIFQDYAALQGGEERIIAPPRTAYRDFVALEKQTLEAEAPRRFWQEKLAGASLQLLPRWPKAMCAGGHEQTRGPEIHVEAGVLQGVKDLARLAGVPLKTVLLAAHQRVMSCLCGQTDITSGLLHNGRPEALDGERIIGLFLNTLPLRISMSGGSWIDLARQCFAAEREIAPHRRFPLSEVQKLNGGRPVFDAAFDFVQFHVYNDLQGGIDLREGCYFEANDVTAFTTFMLDTAGARMEFHIDYDPNRLCRRQIEEMSAYYANTLRAMAATPEARYEGFSPMSDAEKGLLEEWNKTDEDFPRTESIHSLFEKRAQEFPLKIALAAQNEEWTYHDLNCRANDVARKLRELGVGPGSLAGICMERTANMVAGLLGILKTGAAYVPLDPAFPRDRLKFMVEDAKVQLLVTENAALPALPATEGDIVCVDALDYDRSESDESHRSQPDDLAYVIYTSGSTGKPKGVQVTHGAVVNLLVSAGKTIGFKPEDKLLSVTTLSFDIAALEIFLPLISGGQLALAGHQVAADGPGLADLIESSRATVMQATPTTWRLLIESGWTGRKTLRIICGGEALSRTLADALLPRVAQVWNFYGPTETTIWSTAWKVVPDAPISIGRPLANTQLYVLDRQLRPVPVGVSGELHIGGHGLARGYLGRPELTAEKFIANPFSKDGQGRIYKTGDWARYQPDGTVECLGRMDQQVKIRGFRIELGEIETALRQHAGVANALVTAREDASGEKRLVGYLVTRNGPPPVAELREFIRAKLPAYMVPAHFVMLKEFPLTPNGKIDVKKLPAPGETAAATRNYVAPRNEHERALAEVWQEVLALPQISIEDDFFELGADSLSATRAFARINRRLGINLPLRAIFEHPTVASLAVAVQNAKATPDTRPSITLRRSRVVKAPEESSGVVSV